ncbi:MAG: InlB B-repeat-containing protein [Christensenellales bacterium]
MTFNANGGAFDDGKSKYSIETDGISKVTLPDNPEREGYAFGGWFLDKDEWEKEFDADTPVTSPIKKDITVYAKWNEITYTVKFDTKGGSEIEDIEVIYGSAITMPDNPTKQGFAFIGWYLDEECTESATDVLSQAITSDITVYAKWGIVYTISFETNGGSSVDPLIEGAGAEISAPEIPKRTGFEFLGWFTDNDTFENEFTFTTMPEGNTTLYAKWDLLNKGLLFALINDDSEYEVSLGDETASVIEIPAVYQGKSVTSIANNAFASNNVAISSITIPTSVTVIGDGAFKNFALSSILVEEDNEHFSSIDGNLYTKDGKTLLRYAIGKEDESFTTPDGVITIGEWSLAYAHNLNSVSLTDLVTSIEDYAFTRCDRLQSVLLPDSLTVIKEGAFKECNELAHISLPASLTAIHDYAFYDCYDLSSITISENVETIGYWAFNVYINTSITMYIEFESKPAGWHNNWYDYKWQHDIPMDNTFKIWGCELSADKRQVLSFTKSENNPLIGGEHHPGVELTNPYCYNKIFYGWFTTAELVGERYASTAYVPDGALYARWLNDESEYSDLEKLSVSEKAMLSEVWWDNFSLSVKNYGHELGLDYNAQYMINGIWNGIVLAFECESEDYESSLQYVRQINETQDFEVENRYNLQYYNVEGTNIYATDCYSFYHIMTDNIIKDEDKGAYLTKDGTVLIRVIENTEEYDIPEGVTEIANGAFYLRWKLQSITIPGHVKKISSYAFVEGLSEGIIIEDGVEEIGAYAFLFSYMKSALIPSSVTIIGENAFKVSANLTIYTELSEKPDGWEDDWNYSNTVIWGVVLSGDKNYVVSVENTDSLPSNAANPYREGYNFDGWYESADFSGDKYDTLADAPEGVLYAKWAEKDE